MGTAGRVFQWIGTHLFVPGEGSPPWPTAGRRTPPASIHLGTPAAFFCPGLHAFAATPPHPISRLAGLKTVEQGASTTCLACVAEDLPNGAYLQVCRAASAAAVRVVRMWALPARSHPLSSTATATATATATSVGLRGGQAFQAGAGC